MNTAVKSLSAAVSENGATILFEDLPVVSGDAGLLAQVFQNLIGSAIKFRADDPGNGLGLALCQRIVLRHGGTIWMEPSQTPGTTVCFTLNAG